MCWRQHNAHQWWPNCTLVCSSCPCCMQLGCPSSWSWSYAPMSCIWCWPSFCRFPNPIAYFFFEQVAKPWNGRSEMCAREFVFFFFRKITYIDDISPEPVIALVDVQSTSIHQTAPICPFRVPKRSPFTVYQIFGLLSLALDKIISPSRLYLICVMARSCPCKTIGFCKKIEKWWWQTEKTHNLG